MVMLVRERAREHYFYYYGNPKSEIPLAKLDASSLEMQEKYNRSGIIARDER